MTDPCPALAVIAGVLGFARDRSARPILDQPLVPRHRFSRIVAIAPGGGGNGLSAIEPTYAPADHCAHCGSTATKGTP